MTDVLTPIAPPAITTPAAGSPYVGYTYAYPHKSAYRPFEKALPLSDLWAAEDRSRLFLYLHLPFCEHRCGFCNLFTQANPEQGLTSRYLRQLQSEAQRTREALGGAAFVQCAIGGGTPTFLDIGELTQLFDLVTTVMGAELHLVPASCEVSPATLDAAKVALLREQGIDRISIGVQSFDEQEARGMGRPQRTDDVVHALDLIRREPFDTLNVDLIYGAAGQTPATFVASIELALQWEPEEVFLYPLYVRPLTGLGKKPREWDDHRLACYRAGRDRLLSAGYEQISLRMYRRSPSQSAHSAAAAYCCQTDGMVGIGCGARSYTSQVHYSSEYATSRGGVRAILAEYLSRAAARFSAAEYGHRLSPDDQQRRFVLQSLLQVTGLQMAEYERRFGSDPMSDQPALWRLVEDGLADLTPASLALSCAGMERSDAIGPWLYSDRVRELMEQFELR